MSWVFVALLAFSAAVLLVAEWPRISAAVGSDGRKRRRRAKLKSQLTVVRSDTDEFAASVQRDLDMLPTIEEHEPRR